MGKVLNNQAAELEADKIAMQFVNSPDVVKDMSVAYNADFSNIKIHTDSSADAKVKAADRDAIASGTDIFFGKGILESNHPASKGLLAHELAHTMQQGVVSSDGAVSETVSAGAEQGGKIWDWFKRVFGLSRRTPQTRPQTTPQTTPQTRPQTTPQTNQVNGWEQQRKVALDTAMGKVDELMNKSRDNYINGKVEQAAMFASGQDKREKISENLRDGRDEAFYPGRSVYVDYMNQLDSQNVDFESMGNSTNVEAVELNTGIESMDDGTNVEAVELNPDFAGMTGDMLDLMTANMKTIRGRNYITSATNSLIDSGKFQATEDNKDYKNFMYEDLVTGEADAMKEEVGKQLKGNSKEIAAKRTVTNQITRNLKALPKLAALSEGELEKLSPKIKGLYAKYIEFQNLVGLIIDNKYES